MALALNDETGIFAFADCARSQILETHLEDDDKLAFQGLAVELESYARSHRSPGRRS